MIRSGDFDTIYKRWFDGAVAAGFPDMHMPLTTDTRAKLDGEAASSRSQ